jgi:hypothetical protein
VVVGGNCKTLCSTWGKRSPIRSLGAESSRIPVSDFTFVPQIFDFNILCGFFSFPTQSPSFCVSVFPPSWRWWFGSPEVRQRGDAGAAQVAQSFWKLSISLCRCRKHESETFPFEPHHRLSLTCASRACTEAILFQYRTHCSGSLNFDLPTKQPSRVDCVCNLCIRMSCLHLVVDDMLCFSNTTRIFDRFVCHFRFSVSPFSNCSFRLRESLMLADRQFWLILKGPKLCSRLGETLLSNSGVLASKKTPILNFKSSQT